MRSSIFERRPHSAWSVSRLNSVVDRLPTSPTYPSKLERSRRLRWTMKSVQTLCVAIIMLMLASCSVRQEVVDEFDYANKYIGNLKMPIRSNRVSSKFGPRRGRLHTGIDFPAPRGTPVFAAHDGEVIHSGHFKTGYGITVLIRDGNFITLYSHLSDTLLTKGRRVRAGDPIGEVGATGNATGNHLHFETRVVKKDGKSVPIDPERFLRIN